MLRVVIDVVAFLLGPLHIPPPLFSSLSLPPPVRSHTHARSSRLGHVPADILNCAVPSIKEAPDNLWSIIPPTSSGGAQKDAKQSAWILCNTVGRVNNIVGMYKSRFCPGGEYERRKTVRLIQTKTRDQNCDWKTAKWCWPLAQIEEESPAVDMSLPPRGGF